MSETSPEFGGFAGSANDHRGLDSAATRLEREINSFSDSLAKFTATMNSRASQQASSGRSTTGNGGAVSFSGPQHSAAGGARSSGQTSWGLGQTGGAYSSGPNNGPVNGGGATFGGAHAGPTTFSNPASAGSHSAGGAPDTGAYGNVARGATGMALGGMAVYTKNHYGNQAALETIGSRIAGGDWSDAVHSGMTKNYTAHGNADFLGSMSMMARYSGFDPRNGNGWQGMTNQVNSYSGTNSGISNMAATTGILQAQKVGSINRLNSIGINPLNKQGTGDPRSIARQILSRMNSNRVKTKAQADAAFAPNGSATVTLDNYSVNGFLPAGTRELVESEMRNILYAQVNGMEYSEYSRLAGQVNGNDDVNKSARKSLQSAGIDADSMAQKSNRSAGRSRESEIETIDGFVKGAAAATETLGFFRDALNKILRLPVVGEVAGFASGAVGTGMPSGSGGDGPASMSSYGTNFAASAGAAMAGPGFGTGGSVGNVSMRGKSGGGGGGGGTASLGSAASIGNRYSLGAVKPWVAKAAGIIGPKFGIKTIGGVSSRSNVSDHPKGLALDFMCSKSQGDSVAAFAVANHKALNITYVIWRQRIWSINHPGWKAMEDRGSPTANHMDHVHVSFLASPTNGDYSNLTSGGGGLGASPSTPLGSGGSATSLGASAPGGGGGSIGAFSEAAALGLGGSGYGIASGFGGGASGGGGMSAAGAGGGGGGGIKGNYGSAGGPGSLRIGSFNALFTNTAGRTAEDFKKISGKADVIGWQEMHGKHASDFSRWMSKNTNWKYYGAKGGDTAISWNEDKYRALQKGSFDILDRMDSNSGKRNIPSASAYALLQDKSSGSKFWAVSNHLQAHATTRGGEWAKTQKTQLSQLAGLYARLRKTGIPVINVGDWNNAGLNIGGSKYGSGIDKIFAQGGTISGGGSIGAGQTNSDHSFLWANVNLPGGKSSGNGGSVAQNMALGRQMASSRGWTGAQWNDLKTLWMHESGWRTNADNPSSSAYGIPQALTDLHHLGDKYKSDPRTQIKWGLDYIGGRYGNPSSAWDFWQKNHYYKNGSWNISEDQTADVHQGEMILSAKVAAAVRGEFAGNKAPRGGGMSVVFQSGAIVVKLASGTKAEATSAGTMVVDAIMEDRRFKALAEGV